MLSLLFPNPFLNVVGWLGGSWVVGWLSPPTPLTVSRFGEATLLSLHAGVLVFASHSPQARRFFYQIALLGETPQTYRISAPPHEIKTVVRER